MCVPPPPHSEICEPKFQWFLLRQLRFYPFVPLLGGGTTPCEMLDAKVKQKQSRTRSVLKKLFQEAAMGSPTKNGFNFRFKNEVQQQIRFFLWLRAKDESLFK